MKKLVSLFLIVSCFHSFTYLLGETFSVRRDEFVSLEKLCASYAITGDRHCVEQIRELLDNKECSLNTVNILNKLNRFQEENCSQEDLSEILPLTRSLRTYCLEGRYIQNLDEVHSLDESRLDIGRALLLAEFFEEPDAVSKVDVYSCFLDVLALRVEAALRIAGISSTDCRCIDVINKILFEEMGIRFPSKGEMYSDRFTFLASLIKDRYGVCLGVSSLYLALAARIGLPLEIMTPPGHIYLCYRQDDGSYLNIETTAGGIHVDTLSYEGYLPGQNRRRQLKEVIGLSFMNRGSFFLYEKNYHKASVAYREALKYLNDENDIKELYGWALLFSGKSSEGKNILKDIASRLDKQGLVYEFLNGIIGTAAVQLILSSPGDTYNSVNAYTEELFVALKKFPLSKVIQSRLASCFLFLGKYGKASQYLENSLSYNPNEMEIAVTLAHIGLMRMDYRQAYKYFCLSEKWAEEQKFYPEPLKTLGKRMVGFSQEIFLEGSV